MNRRTECNLHENQICNIAHGPSDPLLKHYSPLFIQKYFPTSYCVLDIALGKENLTDRVSASNTLLSLPQAA